MCRRRHADPLLCFASPAARWALPIACLALAAACGGSEPQALSGPVAPPGPAPAIAPPPPAAPGASLSWAVPEGWAEQPPTSAMRQAEYVVPGPAGDAECVVYYFGPGQGGGVDSNVARWIGQFEDVRGEPSVTTRVTDAGATTVVEVAGTFVGGMGPAMGGGSPVPDQKLLAAIAEGADANWFFKLLGPEETVTAQRDAFLSLVDSLEPAAAGGG